MVRGRTTVLMLLAVLGGPTMMRPATSEAVRRTRIRLRVGSKSAKPRRFGGVCLGSKRYIKGRNEKSVYRGVDSSKRPGARSRPDNLSCRFFPKTGVLPQAASNTDRYDN